MIPRLYEYNATTFTNMGICALSGFIVCRVTEARNDQYILEMSYPIDDRWFSELKVDRIILAQAHEGDTHPQPFRIESIRGDIKGTVIVRAVHISYMLNWVIVGRITKYTRYADRAMSQVVRDALLSNSCPFTFLSDIGTEESTPVYVGPDVAMPMRSYLGGVSGSVLDTFGGEYEWDIFDVHLWENRGQDNGVRITYGKNLLGVDWETDISNTYTGVVAYWKQDNNGTITYVESDVQHIAGSVQFAFERTIVVDATGAFQTQPTKDQLDAWAAAYVKANAKTPTISAKINFVPLWQTEEYKEYSDFEKVNLCDTVHVVYPALNLVLDAKVVKTIYNVGLDRYDEIEISTVQKKLAETIFAMQKQIIRNSVSGTNARRLIQ